MNHQKIKHTIIDFGPSLLSIVCLIWAVTMTILYIDVVDEQNHVMKSIAEDESNSVTTYVDFEANATFVQRFHVGAGRLFSENEIQLLQFNTEAYTQNNVLSNYSECNKVNEDIDGDGLINDDDVIHVTSTVINQQEFNGTSTTPDPAITNENDSDFVNEVTYIMSFDSIHNCSDLVEFPNTFFPNYTNRNLDLIRTNLNLLIPGINISLIEMAARIVHQTN
mmetsp:Transcript_21430/g.22923  ORF Transcript_21430/g.22923 Transcript_21430/m.22923 type:complete len:222 (+) Transcript_21430:311-976(+)